MTVDTELVAIRIAGALAEADKSLAEAEHEAWHRDYKRPIGEIRTQVKAMIGTMLDLAPGFKAMLDLAREQEPHDGGQDG